MHLLSGRAAVTPFFHQPARTYVHRISCAAAAGILLALTIGVAAPAAAQIGKTVDGPKVVPFDLNIDLRLLPKLPAGSVAPKLYRPLLKGPQGAKSGGGAAPSAPAGTPGARAPMPGTIQNFAGLNFADLCGGVQCGGGWPPDPNGEVGPNHFIEAVNVGVRDLQQDRHAARFVHRGPALGRQWLRICATAIRQGDPIVVYDPIADRWILTHFAFASGAGPFVQCIAVSKTSDPVAGGWYLYRCASTLESPDSHRSARSTTIRNSPPGTTACTWAPTSSTDSVRTRACPFASFSRADLYNGNPLTWALGFLPYPANQVFSMFPAHSAGHGPTAVQPGTPAFFVNESTTAFNFDVRKFTPGPNCGGGGTLSAATFVPQPSYTGTAGFGTVVPQPNTANLLDNLAGSDHAEGPVPQGRRGRVAVGRPHGAAGVESSRRSSGRSSTSPAARSPRPRCSSRSTRRTDALPLHAEHRRRQPGQRGDRVQHVGADRSRFPQHQVRRTPRGDALNTLPQTEVTLVAGLGSQTNHLRRQSRAIAGAITRR